MALALSGRSAGWAKARTGEVVSSTSSVVVNSAMVLATAFGLTGNVRYRDGAVQAMDHLFGRNALNHSYVAGWGEKRGQNTQSNLCPPA
ncbi:glycoside hydrolase family 9 protein [Streptomyces europaeiscabiei]|uniref:glycoside hydrolase family 9 protein n=1 Tax=Streptomyces europaeiscabiei TaxID=146819 RepID=UPI0029A50A12|nr:glycoside hydrolase family 9 protein [Streptomyces europaeiscabiei]MDX3693731.1 glycoside hydrolase family 9 protein [Streptomyces europaeiscabiei]